MARLAGPRASRGPRSVRSAASSGAGSVDSRTRSRDKAMSPALSPGGGSGGLRSPASVAARAESLRLMEQRYTHRQVVTREMEEERLQQLMARSYKRELDQVAWRRRLRRSPFHVDLVAESERLDEETCARTQQHGRKTQLVERQKERVKNQIILKALEETSDLEALRQEKRAILDEERRLKALLDLERAKLRRKEDVLAAQLAERRRREAKLEVRRAQRRQEVERERAERVALLKEKHAISDDPNPYGVRVGKGIVGDLGGQLG